MISIRPISGEDYQTLVTSLANDEYHKDTTPMFFVESGTFTSVYEDEQGTVLFLRGLPLEDGGIQLDIQFVSNEDGRRNIRVMAEEFPKLTERAKNSGIKYMIFDSFSPLLRKFCIKRLGFVEDTGSNLRIVL